MNGVSVLLRRDTKELALVTQGYQEKRIVYKTGRVSLTKNGSIRTFIMDFPGFRNVINKRVLFKPPRF